MRCRFWLFWWYGLAVGQITSHYFLAETPVSWVKAREFCQRHYVDLAVLSTEEQYFTLLNATASNKGSFWLGLQRESIFSGWKWVNGEELSYEHWYRRNLEGCCASLEAVLEKDERLLARLCNELHMIACQGPVSPQSVTVDSVGTDHVTLSWKVSTFMQMTPHSYNMMICTSTCETLLYPYTNDSAFMNITISNLTSATDYSIEVSAFVVRPDSVTGEETILQNNPTTLRVKTGDSYESQKIIHLCLKLLKLVFLAPLLWILYLILKKDDLPESDHDATPLELSTQEAVVDQSAEKNREIREKEGIKHTLDFSGLKRWTAHNWSV